MSRGGSVAIESANASTARCLLESERDVGCTTPADRRRATLTRRRLDLAADALRRGDAPRARRLIGKVGRQTKRVVARALVRSNRFARGLFGQQLQCDAFRFQKEVQLWRRLRAEGLRSSRCGS